MRRFLIWLSGARPDLLALSPGDRAKYEGIGSAVLITSSLAAISMTFALNTALNVLLPIAVACGAVWGLAIMSLDRWLVVSIQRRPKPWHNLYTAIPRLLLALLFGVVISTPLVLQIFRPEIEAKITQIKQQNSDTFNQRQQSGAVGKEIARLTALRDAQQKIIASGGDVPQNPEADPKVIGLQAQKAAAQKTADQAFEKWQCQLYGGPSCPRKGDGVLAQASERAYNKAKSQVDELNRQIEGRKQELTATDQTSRERRVGDATAELPKLQSRLDTFTAQQQALQRTFDAKNRASGGLLLRLKALDQVSQENGTLNSARILLFLFITSIECLPILVKLLLTFGPENNYEKILAEEEKEEMAAARVAIRVNKLRDQAGGREVLEGIWGVVADPPLSTDPPPTRQYTPESDDLNAPAPHGPTEPEPDYWESQRLRNMPNDHVNGFNGADPVDWSATEPTPPGPDPKAWTPADPRPAAQEWDSAGPGGWDAAEPSWDQAEQTPRVPEPQGWAPEGKPEAPAGQTPRLPATEIEARTKVESPSWTPGEPPPLRPVEPLPSPSVSPPPGHPAAIEPSARTTVDPSVDAMLGFNDDD